MIAASQTSQAETQAPAGRDRSAVWLAVGLAVIVVLLRAALVRPLSFCGTPDACYYLGMAQNLASGHGFVARFLYDYQQAHPTLPNTGVEYWRPGISLLLLVLKPLGGVTLHSSIDLTILVGVLFSAAAWHIAMRAYGDRWLALGSFALCLFSSAAWVGSGSPDSGLYYGAAVAWFLALFTVRRQGLAADVVALVCVCLAYLIRNDAALLLVPFAAVLWQRRRLAAAAPEGSAEAAGSSAGYAALMLLGFLAALVPMHLLYRAVLGTAFPSGAGKALYLDSLGDFGRYNDPVSLHSLLAHGVAHLVFFRIATLATVLYRIPVLMIGYPALVFLPTLLLRDSRRRGPGWPSELSPELPEWTGTAAFFLVAILVYTLVLPAIGGFSSLRTAVGVMPFAFVLVMVAIRRVARTRSLAVTLGVAVIAANALAGLMEARRDLPAANQIGAQDRAEAQELARIGADPARAVVLTNDPVQFSVTTGYATAQLPSNGLDAIAEAARDLHATHVMLDSENLPASSAELTRRLQPVRSVTLPAEHILILELPHIDKVP